MGNLASHLPVSEVTFTTDDAHFGWSKEITDGAQGQEQK
jgi:hypothetical protein